MAGHNQMDETIRRRASGAATAFAGLVVGAFALAGVTDAQAQVGIGVTPSVTAIGTIGHDKMQSDSAPFRCPEGTVGVGLRHRDKTDSAPLQSVRGMTTQFGAFCANLIPTPTGVTVSPLSITTPSTLTNYPYSFQGAAIDRLCGSGQIIHRLGGWDRDWDRSTQYPAWSSALTMVCDSVVKDSSDWVRIGTAGGTPTLVGIIEPPPSPAFPGHVQRGPFCANTATSLVTGLYAQSGGEGIDGINVYCGGLAQARFSAAMTFTDFAWSQTRGTGNWLVDLRLGSQLLENNAGMTGADRAPYATIAANSITAYSVPNEVYVVPNSNYQATVANRPAGIPAAAYVTSGNCTTGLTLANEVDGTCLMNIEGLADLTPTVVSPPNTYNAYNQTQPVTVTITNRGPGATVAGDSFRMTATLPAGWSASGLPAGCTLSGQVVSCPLGALAAAPSPGSNGGQTAITFNVFPVSPTANGTFNMPVVADASTANSDPNPGNNDYDLSNNSTNATLVFLRNAQLNLSKVWSNAIVNDTAVLTASSSTSSPVTLSSTANSASETDVGTPAVAPLGTVYTLGEVLGAANAGAYNPSIWACTGGTLAGNQLTIRNADSGQTIVCTITNTRRASDVRVTKVSNVPTVRAGETIVWTITAINDGPDAANNTVLTDTPSAGLDCNAPPPPACVGTGGATCPAGITASALAGGITIPTFPNGGQIQITLTCRATASGL